MRPRKAPASANLIGRNRTLLTISVTMYRKNASSLCPSKRKLEWPQKDCATDGLASGIRPMCAAIRKDVKAQLVRWK